MSTKPETNTTSASAEAARPSHFIRDIFVEARRQRSTATPSSRRAFHREPNGYLHIGHAKAICLDFGMADDFGGLTNLRFDDTNPEKEEQEYVDSIMEDVRWLGFEWDRLCYASDYFDQLYEWAIQLIKAGKAYVDDHSAEEIRQHRGTLTEPGNSPYRERTVEENLDLFPAWPGRIPRRHARAARQDRYGLAEPEHARPGDVPHPARRASSHRRQVVHLPDV